MANFNKNDEGVSAVLGVILMVAITVILAAVIAAFTFQQGNQMPGPDHQVAIKVSRTDSTHIAIKTMSGDVALLDSTRTYYVWVDGAVAIPSPLVANQIGQMVTVTTTAGAHDLMVIAHFTDGSNASAFSGMVGQY